MSNEGYLIDLFSLIKKLKTHKRIILSSTLVCVILGIIVAFTSRLEYAIEIRALPIVGTTKGGLSSMLPSALSSLGTNFNFSALDNPDIVSTNVYPDLIKSKPFKLSILSSEIHFEKPDSILPLSVYLEKCKPFSLPDFLLSSTVKLPSLISRFVSNRKSFQHTVDSCDNILCFDKKTEDMFYELDGRIKIKVDQITNMITLTIKLPDKKGVAQLGNIVVEKLNEAIINYKIQKAKTDAEFIEKRYNEAYAKFVKAQMNLSAFRDQNKSIISASSKAIEERLNMEFNIAYNVCNSLAIQLEQAQIKIQENKPVLQVIEPAYIPNYKNGPKRILIIVIFSLGGFLFSSGFVLLKEYFIHKLYE